MYDGTHSCTRAYTNSYIILGVIVIVIVVPIVVGVYRINAENLLVISVISLTVGLERRQSPIWSVQI